MRKLTKNLLNIAIVKIPIFYLFGTEMCYEKYKGKTLNRKLSKLTGSQFCILSYQNVTGKNHKVTRKNQKVTRKLP